jgi:hypothetical protein
MSQTYQRHQQGHYQQPGQHSSGNGRGAADLKTMERNNYFYGKLLDVFHLEMEQDYFNNKRRLINRLVIGPGVVCGLDVELTEDGEGVVVTPGLAIDRRGNEIIVPAPSRPVALIEMPPYDPGLAKQEYPGKRHAKQEFYCEMPYAHVVLCYHECKGDPVPALAGDCDAVQMCASGSIREQYMVDIRSGFAPERKASFPEARGGRIEYEDLVEHVTRTACRALPKDGCIPLANIHLRDKGEGWDPEIDISVRPIVYTNRLLYQLIQALTSTGESEASEI